MGRNGHSAAAAKGLGGYLQTWSRLPPLVFILINRPDDPADHFRVKATIHDVLPGQTVVNIVFQHLVQNLVGRQGVLIFLVRAQFGGGGLGQDCRRDQFLAAVNCTGPVDRSWFWGHPKLPPNRRSCPRTGCNTPRPAHFYSRWTRPGSHIYWKKP